MTTHEIQEVTKRRQSQQTEKLIDEMGLPQMIALMAEISYGKAQHLRENWQDDKMAKLWDKDGKLLDRLSPRLY